MDKDKEYTQDQQTSDLLSKIQRVAPLNSEWAPRNRPRDAWKVTGHFVCITRPEIIIQLQKYQGGRNSPAYVSLHKLRKNFTPFDYGDSSER